ncbi:MAG: hypothetical protein EOO15_09680 [Chitinophagaceae bacterium]|nr:MAG: hypothetical protein EOO15_09680 [Chitinophagaceae bacterium]
MRIVEQQNDPAEILAGLPDYLLERKGNSSVLVYNRRRLLGRYFWMLAFLLLGLSFPLYVLYGHRSHPQFASIARTFLFPVCAGIALGTIPWIIQWLFPARLVLDHGRNELQLRRRRYALFETEELIVRDNLFTLSKASATYQLRIKLQGKRSRLLLRGLAKEEAILIARWLQHETGLNIRVSDKYF